jgi:hypothetical protein
MKHQEQFDSMTPEEQEALLKKIGQQAWAAKERGSNIAQDVFTEFERYAARAFILRRYPTLKTYCEIHVFRDFDCPVCKASHMEMFLRDIGVSEDNPRQYEEMACCADCLEFDECFGGQCRYCSMEEERPAEWRTAPGATIN